MSGDRLSAQSISAQESINTGPINTGPRSTGPVSAGARSTGIDSTDPGSTGRGRTGSVRRALRRQEVGYALVGGFNTLLGMVLTVAWLTVLPDTGWAPSAAVALAYAISVVVAFVLHRTLVFRVRGRVLRDFAAFVAVNSVGLVLNMALLSLAVAMLGLPKAPSTVVVMGLVAVVGFFGHRHISFRRRPAVRSGDAVR